MDKKQEMQITQRFDFSAGHHIPGTAGHSGKHQHCPHGHNFVLEITVSRGIGVINSDTIEPESATLSGQVIFQQTLIEFVETYLLFGMRDIYLNNLEEHSFPGDVPSIEQIVLWMVARFQGKQKKHDEMKFVRLDKVELWETPDYKATWKNPWTWHVHVDPDVDSQPTMPRDFENPDCGPKEK